MDKPTAEEYAPAFAGYIARVTESDVLGVLAGQPEELRALARTIAPEREQYRYAAGKWSVREVVGHMTDVERVMGYRAFAIGRGDRTHLPGFDDPAYIAASRYDERSLRDLVEDFVLVRAANLRVLEAFDPAEWVRRGIANENTVSVRALAFIMAGHFRHHMESLKSKYGIG